MNRETSALTEKIQTLTTEQIAAVERFIESLGTSESSHERLLGRASEPSFEAIWSNPEDEVYDDV